MPVTKESLASMSLGLLRANAIAGFDDGTNEADIVSLYYDTFAVDIFSRYPWSFALLKSQLTQDSTAPVNEWTFRYTKPAKAQWIHAIYISDQPGAKPTKLFDIIGNFVHSDFNELWAEYTVYTAESNWPGYFIQYAMHAFAAMIAIPVTDDTDLADKMQVIAYGTPSEGERGGKFAVAASADARQKPGEKSINCELVNARFN